MSDPSDILPLASVVEPATQEEVVSHMRESYESATPTYPIGGGTSLDCGLPGRLQGVGLRLTGLNRIVDYPARDMTITVEAGITMAALGEELARHGQRLPVDAGEQERATLGGIIATNFSGPRRYGYGTMRDFVIGISAIDGRGTPFKAGGRVVKNVAGYDLCKLLTGSFGTLAVITQVTLKVRPIPEATALVQCDCHAWQPAENLLASMVSSGTTPVAIELLRGPAWDANCFARLLVGFEGSGSEVNWQVEKLRKEWQQLGLTAAEVIDNAGANSIWQKLVGFGSSSPPLVLKANVLPSDVIRFIEALIEVDGDVSVLAHAGNGIVIATLSSFSTADAARVLIQKLQPAAVAAGGNVVVWSCAAGELTRQATWGAVADGAELMRSVKKQFDPKHLLNPGRFIYGGA